MNIRSKISRSLVVIIFAAFVIFLFFLDFLMLTGDNKISSDYSNISKLEYVGLVIILLLIYVYIKDKLYKKKIKRSIGLVYRYMYISLVIVLAKLCIMNINNVTMTTLYTIIYMVSSYATAILIRKIVFNVSKSDILSVLGTFAYTFLPIGKCYYDKLIVSSLYSLSLVAAIFVVQVLVDELKQRGIKTKKYILEASILGIIIGISIALGISAIVWIIFALVTVFIASSLDNTHISFPKKVMSSITQKKRESLYKVERININKIFVSLVVVIAIAFLVCSLARFVLSNLAYESNYYLSLLKNNLDLGHQIEMLKSINIHGIRQYYTSLVGYSKTFYAFLIFYIVFMEVLALGLRRKYDTKSTMMKAMFILLMNFVYVLEFDTQYYNMVMSILLILIAIVNTSNIYLNREERIKMLVA